MQYSGSLFGILRGSGAEMLGVQAAGDVRGLHKMIPTAISPFLSWHLNFEKRQRDVPERDILIAGWW